MMKHIRTIIATVTLFLLSYIIMHGNPSILYGSHNLSSGLITAMEQDKEGYVWIGTEYGLNRFDGITFEEYLHDDTRPESIKSNIVRSLFCDEEGRLWIGFLNGIQLYNPETGSFTEVTFTNSQETHSIHDIIQLKSGKILALASHIGIFEIDPEKMTAELVSKATELCETRRIHDIYADSNDRLWICTYDNGIICMDITMNTITDAYFSGKTAAGIGKICQNKNSVLVIVYDNDIHMFDEVHKRFVKIKKSNGTDFIPYDILLRQNGEIVVSSTKYGLAVIDENLRELIPYNITYPENLDKENTRVGKLMEDMDSNLWYSCFQKGLIVAPESDKTNFRNWKISSLENRSDNYGYISCIFKDTERQIWCGTEKGYLIRMDESFRVKQKIKLQGEPTCVFEDSEGLIWIGLRDIGFATIDRQNGTIRRQINLKNISVKSIAQDRDGMLHLAVDMKGIWKYDKRTGNITDTETSDPENFKLLRNRNFNTAFTDSKNRLWIGHYLGASCYDMTNGRFLDIAKDTLLNSSVCYAITETRDGKIWMGTNNGLYSYTDDTGKYTRYTTSDGLSSNMICGLAEDIEGNIWCSTFRGINCLRRDTGKIASWYAGSGTSRKAYSRSRYYSDGESILFGELSGITAFTPPISRSTDMKPLKLTAIHIGNNEIVPGKFKDDILLEHNENTFSLSLSPMIFTETGFKVNYRLLGLDATWHTIRNGSYQITYNGLKPGKYTLEAYIEENARNWETYRQTIRIKHPWYSSSPAILLYIILLVGFFIFLYKTFKKEQTNRNNLSKLELYADLAHEIRSPMTMVMNPIESIRNIHDDQETVYALNTIRRGVERIIRMADQIIGIQRLDKGQIQINRRNIKLDALIEKSMNAFSYQAKKKNICMEFKPMTENMSFCLDAYHLDTILYNLLGNAFKHTPEGGEIIVGLDYSKDNGSVVISVTDSGPGINQKEIKSIFNRFYQAQYSPKGFGIGLNLCKMLVSLHGGKITATNRSDRTGAVFTVTIPPPIQFGHTEENIDCETPAFIGNSWQDDAEKTRNRPKRQEKLLIIDDDNESRLYMEDILSLTYKVATADNGENGLQKALSDLPDIIISDIMMPGIDGFHLAKKLKNNSNTSHIPVVLLTSKQELNDKIAGFEHGADAYITKPFHIAELEAIIDNLIKNRLRIRGKYSGALQEDKIKTIEVKSDNDMLMERVMKVMNENLDNSDLTVELLAREIGISRVQLHRKIKTITGVSTLEFIRNIRLKKAAELLKGNNLNVSQVAYMVGFNSHTHFSTVFKKFYGISPTDYIRKDTNQD